METRFTFYLNGDSGHLRVVVVDEVEQAEYSHEAQAYVVRDSYGMTYGFPRGSVAYYTKEDHDVTEEPSEEQGAATEEFQGPT
jgi:hypothetical protein